MTAGAPLVSYCTNVHAGATFEQVRANLTRHAIAVREELGRPESLGVGLWLPRPAARALRETDEVASFRRWLDRNELVVGTINGFPALDFHQPIVKSRVYDPDWTIPVRLDYTRDLAWILARLLPEGAEGSISTLPLGWRTHFVRRDTLVVAAHHLMEIARDLERIEGETGHLIHLDLEPEPGCALQRSRDVIEFFDEHLAREPELARRYLRVCHDVCHAAVMFEDQRDVLDRYRAHGIGIGKIQVSSAVDVDFETHEEPAEALRELATFSEDRYLHQTMVRHPKAGDRFYDDLPLALEAAGDEPVGQWRVHFHVPIFASSLGRLGTTRETIRSCLDGLDETQPIPHLEVETYAWNVLPEAHRPAELANGIAREIRWLHDELAARSGV